MKASPHRWLRPSFRAVVGPHGQITLFQRLSGSCQTSKSRQYPGLAEVVTGKEIEAAESSFTPGRYVGVVTAEVEKDFEFEQAITDVNT